MDNKQYSNRGVFGDVITAAGYKKKDGLGNFIHGKMLSYERANKKRSIADVLQNGGQ